jgi:carbon storage regulator
MLVLSRKDGEKIIVGNSIVVTVLKAGEGRVRLGIEAPHEIPVYREEIRRRSATSKPPIDSAAKCRNKSKSPFIPEFA